MTTLPVNDIINAFDDMIQSAGVDCTFVLRNGPTFTIKGVPRLQAENPLTDGLQQDNRKLSVMDRRWQPHRPPEKGDQVTFSGQRYAIEEADPALLGNIRIGWRIKLRG